MVIASQINENKVLFGNAANFLHQLEDFVTRQASRLMFWSRIYRMPWCCTGLLL
jgi:hypothetical protein